MLRIVFLIKTDSHKGVYMCCFAVVGIIALDCDRYLHSENTLYKNTIVLSKILIIALKSCCLPMWVVLFHLKFSP